MDTIISIGHHKILLSMISPNQLTLLDASDMQQQFALFLRQLRDQKKLSRSQLAQISKVPAPTIKKFELTGQISLRQFCQLWQTLDHLKRLYLLTDEEKQPPKMPTSIEEVLRDGF